MIESKNSATQYGSIFLSRLMKKMIVEHERRRLIKKMCVYILVKIG